MAYYYYHYYHYYYYYHFYYYYYHIIIIIIIIFYIKTSLIKGSSAICIKTFNKQFLAFFFAKAELANSIDVASLKTSTIIDHFPYGAGGVGGWMYKKLNVSVAVHLKNSLGIRTK